nr:WAP four-disulfide core domain protein 12-like [Anolis sagrei ordinatus]
MKSSTGLIVLHTFLVLCALMPTIAGIEDKCPISPEGKYETCAAFCHSDDDCPGIRKCCEYRCGHFCMFPVERGSSNRGPTAATRRRPREGSQARVPVSDLGDIVFQRTDKDTAPPLQPGNPPWTLFALSY